MIEKLLGISDKSILKKSNYVVYLIGAFIGIVAIIVGAGGLIFRLSDTYKGIVLFQKSNIEYLKSLSQEIHDTKLLDVIELYEINLKALDELGLDFGWLIILFGLLLISNFILFEKLRNKLLDIENKEKNDS